MTEYILVENRTVVHYGPCKWNQGIFQSKLAELRCIYNLTSEGYTNCGNNIEIFPIIKADDPVYDGHFEGLSGPHYTYDTETVTQYFLKVNQTLDQVKQLLKALATIRRFDLENSGLYITVQGKTVFLDTERSNRNIFIQKYLFMNDAEIAEWKFPEGWVHLSKSELGNVIMQGANYVQSQFNWESSISSQVDAATTMDELKSIATSEQLL